MNILVTEKFYFFPLLNLKLRSFQAGPDRAAAESLLLLATTKLARRSHLLPCGKGGQSRQAAQVNTVVVRALVGRSGGGGHGAGGGQVADPGPAEAAGGRRGP